MEYDVENENGGSDVELQKESSETLSELDALRDQADMLGVPYRHNTGVVKLRGLLNIENIRLHEESKGSVNVADHSDIKTEKAPLTINEIRAEASKQVRIRVTCMNPDKKGWEGDFFSVGSSALGTFKEFVPFNNENGWHVSHIIYQHLKTIQHSSHYTVRGPRGEDKNMSRLVNEYAIEVMDPLTKEDLALLAQKQAPDQGTE